ncbi:MAG: hypothetical protein ACFBWO_00345 [Paracoccaceae bacterium]
MLDARGNTRLGVVSEVAVQVASLPFTVRDVLTEVAADLTGDYVSQDRT